MKHQNAVKDCIFCHGAKLHRANIAHLAPELTADQHVFAETPNFLTTPELHPLIDGMPYSLTVPREHYTSFLQVPLAQQTELARHWRYYKLCCQLDKRTCSSVRHVITFEHGQAKPGNKVKSVYHAHIHRLYTRNVETLSDYIRRRLDEVGLKYNTVKFDESRYLEALHDHLSVGEDYLFFAVDNEALIVHDDGSAELESQFFRVELCRFYEAAFENWKTANKDTRARFAKRLHEMTPQALSTECKDAFFNNSADFDYNF